MIEVESDFATQFRSAARRVRLRLGLGIMLSGLAIGAALAALALLACWFWARADLRPIAVAPIALALTAAAIVVQRRRLPDEDVALVLDARLSSHEAITSALSRAQPAIASSMDPVLLSRATSILERAPRNLLALPVFQRSHALLPVGLVGLLLALRLHVPVPTPTANDPGIDLAHDSDAKGLESVIALRGLEARDDAQRDRLSKLAREAERIQKKLRDGASQREVKADLAKLADDVAAERMSLGQGEERKGLESAIAELGKNKDLDAATRALGDHDLTAFDSEMQRRANLAEQRDRDRARKSLEEAEKAAKQKGSDPVARMLAEQRKRFAENEASSKRLRELAGLMGDDIGKQGKEALQNLDQTGDPEAARRLAKAMEDALESLSPSERKTLAERMKKALESQGSDPSQKGAGSTAGPADPEALANELRNMAKAPDETSSEAQREQALKNAERALGGGPPSGPGNGPPGPEAGVVAKLGPGAPGSDDGRAPSGKRSAPPTGKVDAHELRAHAAADVGAGAPMPGVVIGRAGARPGETANARGSGALGAAALEEVGGVDRTDVPQEYREQVGRYFQP